MDVDSSFNKANPTGVATSATQRRYWTIHQLHQEPYLCSIPAFRVTNDGLEPPLLEQALDLLVLSHDSLQVSFVTEREQPVLKLDDAPRVSLRVIDVNDELTKALLGRLAREEMSRPFDIVRAPLLRAVLANFTGKQALLLTAHRIICDENSMEVLFEDLFELYASCKRARETGTSPPCEAALLGRYVPMLAVENSDKDRIYWHAKLAGSLPVLNMPVNHPRPPLVTLAGGLFELEMSSELAVALSEISRRYGVDTGTVLLTIVYVLLFRYTGQSDLIIGTTIPKRAAPASEHRQRLLLLRCQLESDKDFGWTLAKVKRTLEEAHVHQNYSLDALIEELEISVDPSRSEPFDVHVTLSSELSHDPRARRTISGSGLDLVNYELDFDMTQFGHSRKISIAYNSGLFESDTIRRLAGHFNELILSVATKPHQEIGRLNLLTASEEEELLVSFNDTSKNYPQKTVVELFEEQVECFPDSDALVSGDRIVTFAELNRKANQLAHYLRDSCAIGCDDFVDVMMDGSEWLIISMLGILKAGGAYLPIDPAYPLARIAFMLRESRAKVHICSRDNVDKFSGHEGRVIAIDQDWGEIALRSPENPRKQNSFEDLAYIIYTSGSTGKPKGILQTHRCLSNFVQWQVQHSGLERGLRILQFAASSFDVSVQEILHSLLSGGALYLINSELRQDLNAVRQLIIDNGIELVDLPFTVINILFNYDQSLRKNSRLRHLISAGEPLRVTPSLRLMLEEREDFTLHNHYGPSETHMLTSHSISRSRRNIVPEPPLGKPISNMRAYILDQNLQLVPIGVIGEIYIGGPGVSRGYIDQALTREKFLANPFGGDGSIYKSDDLGRWLPDGSIALVGRKGHQVKIRGFRVELGEIEEILLKHESVKECVVAARAVKTGQNELVAYFVGDGNASAENLRRFLTQDLPDYMIPSYFVRLDDLPRSPNGKADRMALPDPRHIEPGARKAYVAPRSATERRLSAIWSEALNVGQVGIRDDFFDLGGDSLKALIIILSAQQQLGARIALRDLFANPTIAELSAVLTLDRSQGFEIKLSRLPDQPEYLLSNAQRRLWLIDQTEARDSALYNVGCCYIVEGKLDVAKFERALLAVLNRHESLRTRFTSNRGEPRQIISIESSFRLEQINLVDVPDAEAKALRQDADFAMTPFSLSAGPLFRARLTKLGEARYQFAFGLHHIVCDAWSLKVLLSELAHYYSKPDLALPVLKVQYRDFAGWEQKALGSGDLDELKDYWHRQLSGKIEPLELPIDRARSATRKGRGELCRFMIGPHEAVALNGIARVNRTSLFVVMAALVDILLHRYTGQQDILLGTPIAGRDHPELQHQIGFYVNTVVLRTRFATATTFSSLVRDLRKTTLDAYEHQAYPFDLLVEELEPPRLPGRHPFFDVWFALQDSTTVEPRLEIDEITLSRVQLDLKVSLFDLSFQFVELDRRIDSIIQYDSDIYDGDTIELMKERLLALVDSVSESPDSPVEDLAMVIRLDRHRGVAN